MRPPTGRGKGLSGVLPGERPSGGGRPDVRPVPPGRPHPGHGDCRRAGAHLGGPPAEGAPRARSPVTFPQKKKKTSPVRHVPLHAVTMQAQSEEVLVEDVPRLQPIGHNMFAWHCTGDGAVIAREPLSSVCYQDQKTRIAISDPYMGWHTCAIRAKFDGHYGSVTLVLQPRSEWPAYPMACYGSRGALTRCMPSYGTMNEWAWLPRRRMWPSSRATRAP